jgi:hypothetical protein
MKNKLLEIFAYLFGTIAVLVLGFLLGTSKKTDWGWEYIGFFRVTLIVSIIFALVLYWKVDESR